AAGRRHPGRHPAPGKHDRPAPGAAEGLIRFADRQVLQAGSPGMASAIPLSFASPSPVSSSTRWKWRRQRLNILQPGAISLGETAMYLPTAFRQDDLAELHAQIRANPFALLANVGSEGVQASHLPLLLEPEEGEFGTLYGHFARANPHWRELQGGGEALAVFSGPDAYVSPGWYPAKVEHGKVVPTWNYIAVHA